MNSIALNKKALLGTDKQFPAEGTVFYEPFADPSLTLMFLIRIVMEASDEITSSEARTIIQCLALQMSYQSGSTKAPTTYEERSDLLITALDSLIQIYNRKAKGDPGARILTGHPKERSLIFEKWGIP